MGSNAARRRARSPSPLGEVGSPHVPPVHVDGGWAQGCGVDVARALGELQGLLMVPKLAKALPRRWEPCSDRAPGSSQPSHRGGSRRALRDPPQDTLLPTSDPPFLLGTSRGVRHPQGPQPWLRTPVPPARTGTAGRDSARPWGRCCDSVLADGPGQPAALPTPSRASSCLPPAPAAAPSPRAQAGSPALEHPKGLSTPAQRCPLPQGPRPWVRESQNHRTVCVGRDLIDHLVPTPLPRAGTPAPSPGCSQRRPTWP